jgi:hypothetical protein
VLRVRHRAPAILTLIAVIALALLSSVGRASDLDLRAKSTCRALAAPASLGGTLLALYREYELHRPDVHNPTITGPVGAVHLGICGNRRYALASFDARYNGFYFGVEDQPERFVAAPGKGWRDIGNTGGDPCGSAPTALLKAWRIVRACPD